MTIRSRSDETSARAARIAAASLLALSALGAAVGSTMAAGNSGSIWTTSDSCSDGAVVNANEYLAGESVYLRGSGFVAGAAFSWTISGKPGGASGDPGTAVVSGSSTADASGGFCVAAYVVAADDWGVYSVAVTQGKVSKHDNYHVDEPVVVAPAVDPTPEPTVVPTKPPADPTPEPIVNPTPEPPADPTAPPAAPTLEPVQLVLDAVATPSPDPAVADDPATSAPTQAVLAERSTGDRIALPETDTVATSSPTGPSTVPIFILAALVGAAVLLTPLHRRKDPASG